MSHESRTEEKQESNGTVSLRSLFITFLKIGSTAFGGFMALISVVQNYAVERRKLLKQEDMLDGISLATILPGPVAVNVVAYVGYRVRGFLGSFVCVTGVILPAFLLLLGLSFAYFRFGQMPMVGKFFMGFIPAVSAIIFAAAWNMAVKTIHGVAEAIIALAAFGLLLGIGGFLLTLAIVLISGLAGCLLFHGVSSAPVKNVQSTRKSGPNQSGPGDQSPLHSLAAASLPAAHLFSFNAALITKLMITFGGMSVLLFGGGYVFIPLIQQVVVDNYGWVTRQEFIDAIAMGQVTPGPILISAAFIGYKVAGIAGAVAATVGIYTPPAVVMLICTRFLDRIKHSDCIKSGMRGIRSAVIGLIAAAGLIVGRTSQINTISLLIFCMALIALIRFKIETAWIIPAAGLAGLLLY